jgi:hypothetical protein
VDTEIPARECVCVCVYVCVCVCVCARARQRASAHMRTSVYVWAMIAMVLQGAGN